MRIKQAPKASSSAQPPVGLIVRVEGFREEDGAAVAIQGTAYPSREKIEVALTDTGKNAENDRRNSIEDHRKGFKFGRSVYKLEEGGIVAFNRAYAQPDGTYKAPWMDTLAYNSQDAQDYVSLGVTSLRMYTPRNTKEVLKSIREELKAQGVAPDEISNAVEKALPPNTRRYYGVVERYEPTKSMTGDTAKELNDPVQSYFAEARFKPIESDGRTINPRNPGCIIRATNTNGEVEGYEYIPHSKFFVDGEMLPPADKATLVLNMAHKLQTSLPDTKLDILPFSEISVSPIALTTGNTGNRIHAFRKVYSACLHREEGAEGVVEKMAYPAALKFSTDGSLVSNISGDFNPDHGLDPVLLSKDGMLKPAPGLDADKYHEPDHKEKIAPTQEEATHEEESTGPRP